MTANMRRRLEAVTAAIAPCLGCVDEYMHQVELATHEWDPGDQFLEIARSANAARVAEGEEPKPELTDEQRRQRRQDLREAAALATENLKQMQAQRRQLLRSAPRARLRTSCEDCTRRRRSRQQFEAMNVRLVKSKRSQEKEPRWVH